MTLSALPKEQEEVGTKAPDFVDDYNDNALNLILPGLPTVCPMMNSKPEMNTVTATLTEPLAKQAKDAFPREATATVRIRNLCSSIDCHGLPVHTDLLHGRVQTVGPSSLRPRLLYLVHCPRLAGHRGERGMYDTMGHEL